MQEQDTLSPGGCHWQHNAGTLLYLMQARSLGVASSDTGGGGSGQGGTCKVQGAGSGLAWGGCQACLHQLLVHPRLHTWMDQLTD